LPAIAAARSRPSIIVAVFTLVASVVAVAGVAAIWAAASLVSGGNAGWMAVIAAADAALLLRLAGYPRGRGRSVLALAITLATVSFAGFLIATSKIGLSMGLRPVEAIGRMSGDLAWLYVQSNSGWVELGWLAAGCALAWRLGR
jgi:hypothetical protein